MITTKKHFCKLIVYCICVFIMLFCATGACKHVKKQSVISLRYENMTTAQQQEYIKICDLIDNSAVGVLNSCKMCYDISFYEGVFDIIVNEDPEYFWISGIRYRLSDTDATILEFMWSARCNVEERKIVRNEALDILESIKNDTRDLQEMSAFITYYQYLYENVTYDTDALLCESAYGTLVEKRGNCQGFAKALRCMCIDKGIECYLISGYCNEIPHMWNLVILNGVPYYVDVTTYSTYGQVLFTELPSAYTTNI